MHNPGLVENHYVRRLLELNLLACAVCVTVRGRLFVIVQSWPDCSLLIVMAAYQFCHFGIVKVSGWRGTVTDRDIQWNAMVVLE